MRKIGKTEIVWSYLSMRKRKNINKLRTKNIKAQGGRETIRQKGESTYLPGSRDCKNEVKVFVLENWLCKPSEERHSGRPAIPENHGCFSL